MIDARYHFGEEMLVPLLTVLGLGFRLKQVPLNGINMVRSFLSYARASSLHDHNMPLDLFDFPSTQRLALATFIVIEQFISSPIVCICKARGMASRRLIVRTFTVILNADKPSLRQRFEVPELESWPEFLSRLEKASDPIPSPILPTGANKNGRLTAYEDRWWFSLLQEKGRERSAWVYMDTDYSYEWMKDKLLAWNTEWKAVMIHHVGPNVVSA